MRKSRFTRAQIMGILGESNAGTTATELGQKTMASANTIRLWKIGTADSIPAIWFASSQLEDENRRKDRIIARMTLEIGAMKELVRKNALGPRGDKKP